MTIKNYFFLEFVDENYLEAGIGARMSKRDMRLLLMFLELALIIWIECIVSVINIPPGGLLLITHKPDHQKSVLAFKFA